MGRSVSDRQRCGLLAGNAVRDSDQLVLRHETLLGESAMHHFSHQTSLTVERIDKHAVADLPSIDARTDFENLACHVKPDDHGQRDLDSGHAAYGEHVVVIEGGRLHPNHNMALFQYRVGEVRHIPESLEASLLFQHYRFHGRSAKDYTNLCVKPTKDASDATFW